MTEDSGHGQPYGHFALTAADAAELRAQRASGTDADMLNWATGWPTARRSGSGAMTGRGNRSGAA